MVWQDTALSIINFGFILTLIPAIIQNYKNKDVKGQSLITYVSTAVLLSIMAYLFLTLELWLSSVATAGTAVTWYILLYQKVVYS
jgi:uncharacterized membrane protein YidH (DUF202 family)